MVDSTEIAADAWPGRRAGLLLTAAGTGLLVIGALGSTTAAMLITGSSQATTTPAVRQINEVALWFATLLTHASLIGGVLIGLGVALFITWEPILIGATNRMHRLQADHSGRTRLSADRSADPAAWSDEVLEPDQRD